MQTYESFIVVFRLREETLSFSRLLNNNGIINQVVNTPKEVGVGCGLSIKVNQNNLQIIKNVLFNSNVKSFVGIYGVMRIGKTRKVKRI